MIKPLRRFNKIAIKARINTDDKGELNMKQYKAVAGPKSINVAKGNTQAAFDLFADIINKEAANGWTYHSMESISVTEKPGCLQQPVPIYYYMLIFEKEI